MNGHEKRPTTAKLGVSDVTGSVGTAARDAGCTSGASRGRSGWYAVTTHCLCGGTIMAADNPGMIQASVQAHNGTKRHRAWRNRGLTTEPESSQ